MFFYDAKRRADQQSLSPRSATSPAAASVVVEASFSGAAEGDGDDTVSTLAEANSVLVAEKSALEKTVLRMVAEKSSLEMYESLTSLGTSMKGDLHKLIPSGEMLSSLANT